MKNTSLGIRAISRTEKYASYIWSLLLLTADYVAIVLAVQGAFCLRNVIMVNGPMLVLGELDSWFVFPVIYIAFLYAEKLYSNRMQFWQVVQHSFRACCLAIAMIIVELYITQSAEHTSRLFVALLFCLSFVMLVIMRFLVKVVLKSLNAMQIPVLIVGAGKTAEILVKGIEGEEGLGYRIIGLLEDGVVNSEKLQSYPVLGGFDDLEIVVAATGVQHVMVAAPGIDAYKQGELIYRAERLVEHVGIVPNLIGMPMGGLEVESLFNEKLMILKVKNNLASFWNKLIKMVFDYVLTVIGTICIIPVLIMIAAWIYIDSPGPVLFAHERIGKNGRVFPCYKFRTMCVDAKERLAELLTNDPKAKAEWERDFKLKNDPRITRSGAFLRKTSLDELPQIFNVLKGEMSMVGPRPVVKEELRRYGAFVDDYLAVRPGITGYWQVNGRSDTTYEERVLMDTWYVQNWSVWLDLMLLWRTVKAVVAGKGAY